MQILNIKINNILSIGSIDLPIEDTGLLLIEGWNYDDNKSNGSGKSSIFNALAYGLYGKMPRKITASEIIRNGQKKGFVEIDVQIGQSKWTVKRGRPTTLQFFENGVLVPITQEEFEFKLGLNYDQFLISMYSAQTMGSKFIFLNDSSKKDFLMKLLNLQDFVKAKSIADTKLSKIELQISNNINSINSNLSKIDAYTESIIDVSTANEEIANLESKMKQIILDIKEHQEVKEPDISKLSSLEDDIRLKLDNIVSAKTQRSMLMSQFKQLRSMVVDFVKPTPDANCPHCNGELTIRGKSVAPSDDGIALRIQHEEHMESIKEQMGEINVKISLLDETISKENELNQLLFKVKQKRSDEYTSYKVAINHISELKSSLKINKSSIDSINIRLQTSKDLEDKISLIQQDIADLRTKNIQLQQAASVLKAAIDVFGPSGAPAYTMDSIIESFNIAIAKILDVVWPLASYRINSYKENADGQITTKFSESFSVAGRESSIGALSGGEQRILSLIIDFAVIDILSSQFGMRLNPIIMDEPFEGLDATSREQVIDILDTLSADRQIIVVDHATEAKSMFTKIIKVEKRSGMTSIAS